MKAGCVLMAAGKSLRFGSNKLTALLCGEPVIKRTFDAVKNCGFSRIIATVSSDATAEACRRYSVPYVVSMGPDVSDSIRTGLNTVKDTDFCMFVNADRPLLSERSIVGMLETAYCFPNRIIRLSYNSVPSNPVIFPREAYERLFGLSAGENGRTVMQSGEFEIMSYEAENEYELLDTDTPLLLAKAEEIYKSIHNDSQSKQIKEQ